MKRVIIIGLLFSIFCSCKKDKQYIPFVIPCELTRDLNLSRTYIKGTWEWLEEHRIERGPNGERYLTPKTEGYTRKMIIGESTLQFFKNNKLTLDSKYKIQLRGELSGTNYPEDSLSSFVLYDTNNIPSGYGTPIKICNLYLVIQYQFTSSIVGEEIWKKQ